MYFTGRRCCRGHLSPRYASNGKCRDCALIDEKKRVEVGGILLRERRNRRHHDRMAGDEEYANRVRIQGRVNIARRRSSDDEYYAKQLEIARAYKKRRRDTPALKERDRIAMLEWQKNNPEKVRARNHNRRAKVRGAVGRHTHIDINSANERQGFVCVFCPSSTKEGYHVDHIIPIARGGTNWPDNIQILCASCNLRKGAKTNEEYAEWLRSNAANDNSNPIRKAA